MWQYELLDLATNSCWYVKCVSSKEFFYLHVHKTSMHLESCLKFLDKINVALFSKYGRVQFYKVENKNTTTVKMKLWNANKLMGDAKMTVFTDY